jgi:sugar phosphate isomerase/epimerase
VPLGTGLIDLPAVVTALKEGGYNGLLAVEVDHPKDGQDEQTMVALGVAYLKKLIV